MLLHEELSGRVLGAAIEVHRQLGPGLLESSYEECLCAELSALQIPYERQLEMPLNYKNVRLDCGYKIDILVDKKIVLELKSVEALLPIHEAQMMTYLKLSGCKLGLLINFNVVLLKDGIKRVVL